MLSDLALPEDAVGAEQLRFILDAIPLLVAYVDRDHRYQFNNRAYELWFGVTTQELRGRHVRDVVGETAYARTLPRIERALAGQCADFEEELQYAAGHVRFVRASYRPRVAADGQVIGFVALVEDITLQKTTEARLRESIAQAEEASRLKDEFLSTASHELRTPLNAILGWTRMLRSGSIPAENAARALEIVERNARLQAQLVDDLLEVSRIITGKLRLDVRAVALAQTIQAALDSVRPAAAAKAIALDAALGEDPGIVAGDPDRLQQVIWNLLSNAVKFTPPRGKVSVRLGCEGERVTVTVADTGIGIAAEFMPYVFDRFRQADTGHARNYGGLGLGLAISKQLVDMHGGTIAAESAGTDRGATFRVSFPLLAGNAAAAALPTLRAPAVVGATAVTFEADALAGLRVLVVDDEEDARDLLRTVLFSSGAEVDVAASAAEALSSLDRFVPDVMLCDVGMPGVSGYELMRRVRARPASLGGQVPAAALTAYAHVEDRTRALLAGFEIHVPKPVDPVELIAAVESLARRSART